MKGPKSFEEWVRVYEERDSDTEYVISSGERIVKDPMHGFFTYWYDAEHRELVIPKMCGDGKFWRKVIYEMVLAAGDMCRGVLCCTKRNPKAWVRVHGGRLRRVEYTFDFETKKSRALWFIFITPGDTKEGQAR
jgi:hypothetical protein